MASLGTHLEIPDPRGRPGCLRLSWHASRGTVVVSHWRNGVCVSTTPLGIAEIGQLATFLVSVLADAVAKPPASLYPEDRPGRRGLIAWIRNWLQPKRAPVVGIADQGDNSLVRSA